MAKELTQVPHRVAREENTDQLQTGQWYWVTSKNYDGQEYTWLGCVTHIGTNFAQVTGISDHYGSTTYQRVHFDVFPEVCTYEPDAEKHIRQQVGYYSQQVQQLIGEVKQLTAALSITPRAELAEGGGETQALALRGGGQPIGEYKQALIKANKETLPGLFEQIKKTNEKMASWMRATLIPLEAEANGLKGLQKLISNRIFNVELYAGLIEQVVQVKEGEPAPIGTPITLFQRRAYMDEECLANYQTGGMVYQNLEDFDQWVAQPDNLERLLPQPRCIVAFQIRRHEKERHFGNLSEYVAFAFSGQREADKLTFLYMRNGDQLFRLSTGIEFGAQLFPDTEHNVINGKVYANKTYEGWKLIGEAEYKAIGEVYQTEVRKRQAIQADLKARKVPKKEWGPDAQLGWPFGPRNGQEEWTEYTQDSVDFDSITEGIQDKVDHHNRLVLVLQGLLDRSPVFHPHPPWQLWARDSFEQAIRLVYDDTRVLTDGDKPDFEAYRARLSSTLQPGSVTVGQQDAWLRIEAARENARRDRDWRSKGEYRHEKFQPYGNPGPGELAVVQRKVGQKCTYRWARERMREPKNYWEDSGPVQATVTVDTSVLLNVDAYTPGDFKLFFSDPRTRAEYMQWAPLLLEAEEWYANNRQI